MSNPLISAIFDPSGSHLATGVIDLDTHIVRVQSTNPSSSSLTNSIKLDKGSRLTNLNWGFNNKIAHNKTKKFKSNDLKIEDMVIAICLNKGEILIYSPFTNEIISKLTNPQSVAVSDFHYSKLTTSGWSCDNNGVVSEWDLRLFKQRKQFQVNNDNEIKKISVVEYLNRPHLLVCSHSIYLIDPLKPENTITTFPGHISPIHTILPIAGNPDLFLTAATNDRFINLYSIKSQSVQTVFVAQSSVLGLSFGAVGDQSILCAITEDGYIETFNNPIVESEASLATVGSSSSKKNRRKGVQSRPCNGTVKLSRPVNDKIKTKLVINSCLVQQDQVIISWLEDSKISYFEKLNWVDNPLSGEKVIYKHKPDLRIVNHSLYGSDIAAPKVYNEGNVIVTDGDNFKDLDTIQDEEEEEEGEEEETLADQLDKLNVEQPASKKVKQRIGATSGTLTVVLSQALKANDHSLLETVLVNRDENIIRGTIQRLDSNLAIILLNRLAEKIARQSGRQGQLNIWIKWIMIIHGGYLVTLPNLSKVLSSLHTTLSKRASTLPRLMELSGKLDMCYSQIEIKRDLLGSIKMTEDTENESDVEYNEELDDARESNLIDDVSEESESDMDMDLDHDDYLSVESSDGEGEDEDTASQFMELEAEDEDEEANEDDDGFSDVEVGIEKEENGEDTDSGDDLKVKVKKMKADKRKK